MYKHVRSFPLRGLIFVTILCFFIFSLSIKGYETKYKHVHLKIRTGYFAKVSDNSLIIKPTDLGPGKTKKLLSFCENEIVFPKSIIEFIQGIEFTSGNGVSPSAVGVPVQIPNATKYFSISDWVELKTPYIPLCSNIYMKTLDPKDVALPHKAYLFMLKGRMYEIILFSPDPKANPTDFITEITSG